MPRSLSWQSTSMKRKGSAVRARLSAHHLCRNTEQLDQGIFVEADNYILVVNYYYRYAHLPAFFNHFRPFSCISADIVVSERNIIGGEKLFSHAAEVATLGRVNFYFFHLSKLIASQSFLYHGNVELSVELDAPRSSIITATSSPSSVTLNFSVISS